MESHTLNLSPLFLLLVCSIFMSFMIINNVSFSSINSSPYFRKLKGRQVVSDTVLILTKQKSPENLTAFCVNNVLDLREYHYAKWSGSSNNMQILAKTKHGDSCQLMKYTARGTVACFDNLLRESGKLNFSYTSDESSGTPGLHFIFLGDSRTRQQFINFARLIPDYDREIQPYHRTRHDDTSFYINLLKLRVSFKWRPRINNATMETIYELISKSAKKPYMILLGIEVYHMLQEDGDYFAFYREKLLELSFHLRQLARFSKIVWLNQYPTLEFYGNSSESNTHIHSSKIHHYNEEVRTILQNHDIRIWDSSNPLAEEFVRGCAVFSERAIHKKISHQFVEQDANEFFNIEPFIDCQDYIHIGYTALSQATHLLYNDICNSKLQRSG